MYVFFASAAISDGLGLELGILDRIQEMTLREHVIHIEEREPSLYMEQRSANMLERGKESAETRNDILPEEVGAGWNIR